MNKEFSVYISPLSDETKRIKRNLLITSCICIFIFFNGTLPASFTIFSAKFELGNDVSLGYILLGLICYFYLHFISSAFVESSLWFKEIYVPYLTEKKVFKHASYDPGPDYPLDDQDINLYRLQAEGESRWTVQKRINPFLKLIYLKLFIELVLPVALGGYAIYLVISLLTKP